MLSPTSWEAFNSLDDEEIEVFYVDVKKEEEKMQKKKDPLTESSQGYNLPFPSFFLGRL